MKEHDITHLEALIPTGLYCYSYTGRVMINNKFIDHSGKVYSGEYYFRPEIKPCSFWKGGIGVDGVDAYCAYMAELSTYGSITSLVWDQIKECGVNVDDGCYIEFGENNPTRKLIGDVTAKQKKTSNFIDSLIAILLETDNNCFTYDNITYVLHPKLFEELSSNS